MSTHMTARLALALSIVALLLAGCGASSPPGPPRPATATPLPELSVTDFYNVAWWVDSNPAGCAAYLDSYGGIMHQNARYYPHDQPIRYGMAYLATVEKYCRRRDWTNTKAAADVMKAWAQANGG